LQNRVSTSNPIWATICGHRFYDWNFRSAPSYLAIISLGKVRSRSCRGGSRDSHDISLGSPVHCWIAPVRLHCTTQRRPCYRALFLRSDRIANVAALEVCRCRNGRLRHGVSASDFEQCNTVGHRANAIDIVKSGSHSVSQIEANRATLGTSEKMKVLKSSSRADQ